MKAFVIEDKYKCSVQDIPVPEPADDEILIKVMAVGICGTDAHLYKGEYDNPYPTIPGHEYSGIIEAVGKDVKYFKAGQRVAADPNIYCEACDNCKQNRQNFCLDYKGLGLNVSGAFQQYMVINHRSVFDIGDLDFTTAAMTEPLSCVIHGHDNARPAFRERVLIFGAGPIGLLHLQLCKRDGASSVTVIDLKQENLELAKKLGADFTVLSSPDLSDELKRISADGFNLIIDCTGVPDVIEKGLTYLADEGRFLIFGVCPEDSKVQISPYDIFNRELKIIGSFSLKKTFKAALDMLKSGHIVTDCLIGEKILLDELPEKLVQFANGKTKLKTIVYPNGFVD